jgi:2-polyprenyl-3-methyl-5-hydroxy-6-metoxy-1,4-benzoquinol methylase
MNEDFLEFSEQDVARRSDESAKSWTDQVRKGLDIYREYFNNPAFFEFVGTLKRKRVLDAGCGEGYNTRIMARMGARVTGVDISRKLIEMARREERTDRLGARYHVASFTDLSIFDEASFDVVISIMALDASPNFGKAIGEFIRVLSPGGKLFFSILHPCLVTKGLGWIKAETGEDSKLMVSHYFDESPRLEEWTFTYALPGTKPFVTPAFYRTLSRILKTLTRTGFLLKDVEEPRPSQEACKKFPGMKKWREHAALFLYVHCEKPGFQDK